MNISKNNKRIIYFQNGKTRYFNISLYSFDPLTVYGIKIVNSQIEISKNLDWNQCFFRTDERGNIIKPKAYQNQIFKFKEE